MRTRKTFAVTGGIACGKSTVAKHLADLGCRVLDTDEVAHKLESANGGAVPELVRAFGSDILASDGSIDRRKLGLLVFSNPDALKHLNSIMHPMIIEEVRVWIDASPEGSINAVLVPLLFESKFNLCFEWDAIVAVICSEDEQIRRVCLRGFREEEARVRIKAQMPCREKAALSDYVIENDGALDALKEKVVAIFNAIASLDLGEKNEKIQKG